MPVQIDEFQTEIEMTPTKQASELARPRASAPASHAMSAEAQRRSVLEVLEAELDHYLRMRG